MTAIGVIVALIVAVVGVAAGYFIGYNNRKKTAEAQIGSAEAEATRLVNEAIKTADQKRKEAVLEAKDEAFRLKAEVDAQKAEADKEIKQRRAEISRQENRIDQKETALDRKTEALEKKEEELKKRAAEAEERLAEIDALRAKEMERLETLAGLSQEDAREVLLHKVDEELTHEKAVRVAAYETDLKENCDNIARNLIGQAVSRCAADHCSETTVSVGGSSKDGKRAALIHLYFNVIGSVILLALIYAVQFTIGIPMWGDVMNKSSIANIHTLSSVCAMLLFLPCSGVLSRLAMLTVPSSVEEAQELSMPVLDERLYKSPAVALQQAKNAVIKMSRRAARNVGLAAPLLLKMDEETVSAIKVRENLIDRMEVEITNYLIKLTDQELGDDESHAVTELLNFVTEFERIGDYAVNIMEKAEELYDKEASFSESAKKELQLLDAALERILVLTDEAFENDDVQKAAQVEPLEEIIDVMVERLRDQHILRLKDGICSIDTGVVFLDVLNNAERISDHCSNIAVRMVGMEAGEDYDSHTLKSIMHHNPSKDYMLEYEQCRKEYLVPLEEMEA